MKHTPRTTLLLTLMTAALGPCAVAAEPADAKPEVSQQKLLESFDSLADTLGQAKQQVTRAVAERDRAMQALASTRKTVGERDRQIEQLKRQLAESQKQAREWEQRSKSHEATAAEWKKKAEQLDQRLAIGKDVQKRLGGFRERLEKTANEFTALESELTKLREELKEPRDMAALVKENQKLKADAGRTTRQLEQRAKAQDTLNGQLTKTKNELQHLRQHHGEFEQKAEATAKELAKTKRELQHLREHHAEFEQQAEAGMKEAAQKQQAAIKKALLEANQATQQMVVAKDRADAAAGKLKRLESELAAAEKRRAELNSELSKRKKTIEALREKLKQQQSQKQEQARSES